MDSLPSLATPVEAETQVATGTDENAVADASQVVSLVSHFPRSLSSFSVGSQDKEAAAGLGLVSPRSCPMP